jgi:predicted metal-dependent peptidase
MTSVPQNIAARLTRARTDLLLSHPFFGALLFRLKLRPAASVPLMATDGVSLLYNPAASANLKHAELVFVLAHEVMHPALQHHTRRGTRDPKLWNVAADYAINPLLVDAGLFPPEGILIDGRFRGMSAEQIYHLLAQQQEEDGIGDEGDSAAAGSDPQQAGSDPQSGRAVSSSGDPQVPETPGGIGQVLDAPNPDDPGAPATPEQLREQQREWRVAVQQAHNAAKIAGKCPAGVDRALEFSEEASVDWREALRRCFSETVLVDYTWSRPNRRFVGSGLYLPGPKKEGAGEVAIAVDCSGSIDNRTLSLFAAELGSLIEESHPERVHVLYFDTQVQRADLFEFGQPIRLEPKGGGGTDFRPVFAYLEEQAIEPHAIVFLTDLCGRFPQEKPRWPVIWASTEKTQAPFGATVYMGAA